MGYGHTGRKLTAKLKFDIGKRTFRKKRLKSDSGSSAFANIRAVSYLSEVEKIFMNLTYKSVFNTNNTLERRGVERDSRI